MFCAGQLFFSFVSVMRFPPAVISNTISFINSIFLLYHKRNYISSMKLYYLTVHVFHQKSKSMGSDDLLGGMLLTGARWWWA